MIDDKRQKKSSLSFIDQAAAAAAEQAPSEARSGPENAASPEPECRNVVLLPQGSSGRRSATKSRHRAPRARNSNQGGSSGASILRSLINPASPLMRSWKARTAFPRSSHRNAANESSDARERPKHGNSRPRRERDQRASTRKSFRVSRRQQRRPSRRRRRRMPLCDSPPSPRRFHGCWPFRGAQTSLICCDRERASEVAEKRTLSALWRKEKRGEKKESEPLLSTVARAKLAFFLIFTSSLHNSFSSCPAEASFARSLAGLFRARGVALFFEPPCAWAFSRSCA